MDLLRLIREAKLHWEKYVELTDKIDNYLTEKFRVSIGYRYAGEDVHPYEDEVKGIKTEYCVPVTILHEKGIELISEYGNLCILENGEAWFITENVYVDKAGEIHVGKKYKKLGKVIE